MLRIFEDIELFIVISLTLFAKWLMTEDPVLKTETREQKIHRRKRAYGGVIAGALIGYYGPDLLILWSSNPDSFVAGFFTQELLISMTIIMALSGEHIFRVILTKLPFWIERFVDRRIDKS